MPNVFAKLNLKDHKQTVVIDALASFESEFAALKDFEILRGLKKATAATFSLAFVTTQARIDAVAPPIARKVEGDSIVWFAYPKGSSKKYKSQIDRDHGWSFMGRESFEPVRTVAIDEDWSAVRFRREAFIKALKRGKERRLTAGGRERAE